MRSYSLLALTWAPYWLPFAQPIPLLSLGSTVPFLLGPLIGSSKRMIHEHTQLTGVAQPTWPRKKDDAEWGAAWANAAWQWPMFLLEPLLPTLNSHKVRPSYGHFGSSPAEALVVVSRGCLGVFLLVAYAQKRTGGAG